MVSGSGLSCSGDQELVGAQSAESYWAAGMQFLCADTDFGTESELGAVGEGRAHIGIYTCGIDSAQELFGGGAVFGYYAFAVV